MIRSGHGLALGPQVAQIPLKLLYYPPVASCSTAPLQPDCNAALLSDSLNQRADDNSMGMILDEQSDPMHRSRL